MQLAQAKGSGTCIKNTTGAKGFSEVIGLWQRLGAGRMRSLPSLSTTDLSHSWRHRRSDSPVFSGAIRFEQLLP